VRSLDQGRRSNDLQRVTAASTDIWTVGDAGGKTSNMYSEIIPIRVYVSENRGVHCGVCYKMGSKVVDTGQL
jgi:hypothetical protein